MQFHVERPADPGAIRHGSARPRGATAALAGASGWRQPARAGADEIDIGVSSTAS